MASEIRILLVDDHSMVRSGMRLMFSADQQLTITAEADTAQQALTILQNQKFDVALIDISLPDKSGLELLKNIAELYPKLAVLVISMHAEEVYALRALKQGAAGYLTKNSSAATLIAAVRKAAAGGKVVSANTAQQLASLLGGARQPDHEQLSDRELEVMKQIAKGESLVDIATRLHVSPSTVTTYRTRILEKMQMKTNADLTRYVFGNNLFQ